MRRVRRKYVEERLGFLFPFGGEVHDANGPALPWVDLDPDEVEKICDLHKDFIDGVMDVLNED